MKKISIKLAVSFFIVVLVMQLFLMVYLHQNMLMSRVDEEFSRLLINGANHRDVLVENFSPDTIHHIVLMEKNAEREVFITDEKGAILKGSTDSNAIIASYFEQLKNAPIEKDLVIESDWRNASYIVSIHPYEVGANHSGYVMMLQKTNALHIMLKQMNKHFIIAGITSFIVLFFVYALLSNILTRPLLRMQEATKKLSTGVFQVNLPNTGHDELGELARSIEALAKELEHVKNSRNEFLASIAHELSTPLTYVIGYSKIAKREQITNAERQQYLTIIAEESNRLKDLVKNLLDLARMDETNFTIDKTSFNAYPFLKNICNLVEPSYKLRNIQLKLKCHEHAKMTADPIRLEQIIFNLLDNALKYSNDYDVVTLQLSEQAEKTIISVIDTGIGIPEDELPFIFERLYRVEKSRSRAHGGTGIGLAIVKELVEAHGGTIEVRSKLGEGTTFTIML